MLALLLSLSTEMVAPIPAAFDLADIVSAAASEGEERDLSARYLLPDIDEPDEERGGIKVKLKWRKVRVTVPIDGLQPPF